MDAITRARGLKIGHVTQDVPPDLMALGLRAAVLAALADVGYEAPSPIQAATIPVLLSGADLEMPDVDAPDPAVAQAHPLTAPETIIVGDVDVGGRQQEDLGGDFVEGATEREGESGGEVDESFGVVVTHVDEVHDDGAAVAVAFADSAGFAVVGGPQGGDLVQRSVGEDAVEFVLVAAGPYTTLPDLSHT